MIWPPLPPQRHRAALRHKRYHRQSHRQLGEVRHRLGRLVRQILVDEHHAQHGPCVLVLQHGKQAAVHLSVSKGGAHRRHRVATLWQFLPVGLVLAPRSLLRRHHHLHVVRPHQSPEWLVLHVGKRLRDVGRKDSRLPQVPPPHLPKPLHQLIRQFDLWTPYHVALHQIYDSQQQHRLMRKPSAPSPSPCGDAKKPQRIL